MKTLSDIPVLRGVKVLLRADFNVPILHGAVVDDYRIRMTVPTIDFLRKAGAKVIIVSHIEVVEGEEDTLEPVIPALEKIGQKVSFVKNWKNAMTHIASMNDGDCILLENLRHFEGEKKNDPKFAKELASLADIYVNDAFSVSHREHASVVGVPALLPGYAGLQLQKEITSLSRAFNPAHPFVFILGGAKFDTKLPLLTKFLTIADKVFVGGALSNDLFKLKGYEIGRSLVSSGTIDLSAFAANPKVVIPVDVYIENNVPKSAHSLSIDDKIMDSGPETVKLLADLVKDAKFILWNGPLGMYEDGYRGPTLDLAKMIGEATARGAETIVGGGDTLAAIATLGIQDKFSFISTGGGAMLDFLAQGSLPGVAILEKSVNLAGN